MRAGDRLTLHNTPTGSPEFRLLCTPVVLSERAGHDTGLSADGREFRVPMRWIEALGLMLATQSDFGVQRGEPPFALDRFWLWQIVKFEETVWRSFTVAKGQSPTMTIHLESRVVRPLRHALREIHLDLGLVLERDFKEALLAACLRP